MSKSEITSVKESPATAAPEEKNLPHRILVVDDENDSRQLTVDLLVGSGYKVETAKDGADAWAALKSGNYNLVITDNKMPRMTGVEMLEELSYARNPVPVIMATRYLPVFDFVRKPWLKPEGVLQRPFSNDELLAMVKNILRAGDGNARKQKIPPPHP
jgi:DNA-binding response OmpR family regulator